MNILCIGCTGLIGSELLVALYKAGHNLFVAYRSKYPSFDTNMQVISNQPDYTPFPLSEWRQYLDGTDAIINLSGAGIADKRWSSSRKKTLWKSRVPLVRDIANELETRCNSNRPHPSVWINASAVGYYGNRMEQPCDEQQSAGQDFTAVLAKDWEDPVRRCGNNCNAIRTVTLRTGIVLTPKGGALAKMITPFKLGLGGPLGSGRQWFPWIHIQDEIRAILFALHKNIQGPINLCSPQIVRMKEFSNTLGSVLHRPAFIPVPSLALQLALGEMATIITGGQMATPQVLQNNSYTFLFPDLKQALQDLLL
jgi:uncharacterized protein